MNITFGILGGYVECYEHHLWYLLGYYFERYEHNFWNFLGGYIECYEHHFFVLKGCVYRHELQFLMFYKDDFECYEHHFWHALGGCVEIYEHRFHVNVHFVNLNKLDTNNKLHDLFPDTFRCISSGEQKRVNIK